jgi:transposase
MQATNANTPIMEYIIRIFVAIELSQGSCLVTMRCPDKDKISRHKLGGGDYAGLLALFNRMRERVARALGADPVIVSCYEAGYDGFWLHRLLTGAGLTNYVFDPSSIAVD